MISLKGEGREPGSDAGAPVEVGMGSEVGMGLEVGMAGLRSVLLREEKMAAVAAAPVAALMPAMMARVVFDMIAVAQISGSLRRRKGLGALYESLMGDRQSSELLDLGA